MFSFRDKYFKSANLAQFSDGRLSGASVLHSEAATRFSIPQQFKRLVASIMNSYGALYLLPNVDTL